MGGQIVDLYDFLRRAFQLDVKFDVVALHCLKLVEGDEYADRYPRQRWYMEADESFRYYFV